MNPSYEYRMTIERWVDGDTFDATVDLGFYTHQRLRFRLLGVDTPERGQPNFDAARELCEEFYPVGSSFVARSAKAGKYGRWLVALPDLNAELTRREEC